MGKILDLKLFQNFKVDNYRGYIFRLVEKGLETREESYCDDWYYTTSQDIIIKILNGECKIIYIPEYTIPEDTPIDTRVWVKEKRTDDWEPWHFAGFMSDSYAVWADGATSFSVDKNSQYGMQVAFKYCITDEEHIRREREFKEIWSIG